MQPITTGRLATLAAALTLSCALPPIAHAQDASVAEQTVNVMNKMWGQHPGYRANHAKGVVVDGTFTPAKDAASLSKTALFKGPMISLTARFSDSTGLPDIADGSAQASPHGMSIKFHLPDGSDVDIVENSLKFFPVSDGEEFLQLLQAASVSGPDAPKPTKLDQFFESHPQAPKAFGSTTTPTSYARETYNGIDTFIFVSADGKRQPFRFQVVPEDGAEHMSAAEAAKQKPDFLTDDIRQRLAKGQVRFHLKAQLAAPGDQTKDPTQPWPDDRKVVDLGVIALTKAASDNDAAQKALLFLPNNLTDGIEVSDDPLIDARDQAYAVSYGRRSQ